MHPSRTESKFRKFHHRGACGFCEETWATVFLKVPEENKGSSAESVFCPVETKNAEAKKSEVTQPVMRALNGTDFIVPPSCATVGNGESRLVEHGGTEVKKRVCQS